MSGLLFVPQTLLDEWLEHEQADVTADGLQLLPSGPTLALDGGYRFVELLDGADDAALLGRVKSEAQLRELGADPCGDSVLLGDVVYEVIPGFIARTPLLEGGAVEGPMGDAEGANVDGEKKDDETEGADLLSTFFR